jgi:hypothetical protein
MDPALNTQADGVQTQDGITFTALGEPTATPGTDFVFTWTEAVV